MSPISIFPAARHPTERDEREERGKLSARTAFALALVLSGHSLCLCAQDLEPANEAAEPLAPEESAQEAAPADIAPQAPPELAPKPGLDLGLSTQAAAEPLEDGGAGDAGEDSFWNDIQWRGYFKNETAYRYKEPRSITKIRNIFSITGSYAFNDRVQLTATGQAWYDLAYAFFDYDTIAARLERNNDEPLAFIFNLGKEKDVSGVDLREFYFDFSFDNIDLRLGRQFVVWGVLEGVRIVDEINPQDFRELMLPDLLDYRIPLWMAKAEWFRPEGTWQFLWIPDMTFHEPAPPGSEWELLQEVPGTIYPSSSNLRNSEWGVRLSTSLFDADVTFSYFYTWDDFQVVFRRILLNQLQLEPQFIPTYTRIGMWGSTFSRQVGPTVLKGEFAYVTGKYFAITDIDRNGDGFLDTLGEQKHDHIRWGLGVEFNVAGMDISPGVNQWFIVDYDEALVQSEFDTSYNLFLRKEYPQSSMLFEFLAIWFQTQSELYLNPKWTFLVTDRLQVGIGADMFSGKQSQFGVLINPLGSPTVRDQRSQFVGNFHDNDRVFFEVKYAF